MNVVLRCCFWGLACLAGLQSLSGQTPETAPQSTSASPQSTPSVDPDTILNHLRDWGSAYIGSLPDFLCAQTTEQFRGDSKGKRWKQGDTYVSKLVFSDGREKRTLQSVNGKEPSPSSRGFARRPLTTEGEFGILLANVTGDDSAAHITLVNWEQSDHGKLAVFHYVIDQEHSTVVLTDGPYQAKLGYDGDIAAEPDTGRVWRITSHVLCPEKWEMRSMLTTIQYRPFVIGGKDYLLPSEATVEAELRDGRIRNQLHFTQYQKFETGSTITFGPPDQ